MYRHAIAVAALVALAALAQAKPSGVKALDGTSWQELSVFQKPESLTPEQRKALQACKMPSFFFSVGESSS